MAYVVRSKDNPGEVGRAADQQQSIDNESALYAAILGPGPVATGGMVKQFVKKTGMADNVATEVFTITTTNEAGNTDGGVYMAEVTGVCAHGIDPTLDTSLFPYKGLLARAMAGGGTGVSAAPVSTYGPPVVSASTVGTKTLAAPTMTLVETSEYVLSVQMTLNLSGGTITTGSVFFMVELIYAGFTTPPVITSAE